MKNSTGIGLAVTILIIVVPIVWCCISLVNINKDYENNIDEMQSMTDNINDIVDNNFVNNVPSSGENNTSGDTYQGSMGGESYETSIGTPIGKIVEGATINIAVANVYSNPDENSTILGTINKNTSVTVHDFPNGWSRIKVGELSGWTRTEYITKPDDIGDVSIGTVIGKTAIIDAESLNVREAPVNGKIIERLTRDTEVKILEVNDDSTWYKVQWRTTYGWISAEYAKVQY